MWSFILFGVHASVVKTSSDLVPVRQIVALNVPRPTASKLLGALWPADADSPATEHPEPEFNYELTPGHEPGRHRREWQPYRAPGPRSVNYLLSDAS